MDEKRQKLIDILQETIYALIDAYHAVCKKDKRLDPACIVVNLNLYAEDIRKAVDELKLAENKEQK